MQLRLELSDLEDLPSELLEELSISSSDKAEYAILNILEEAGEIATLDQLLVALYNLGRFSDVKHSLPGFIE